MNVTHKISILIVTAMTAGAFGAATARAESQWAKDHPRQEQVKKRDRHLENKTQNAAKDGKITQAQAQNLEKKEAAINQQRKDEATVNGGYITKGEQKQLNHEENQVNRDLKHDERKDAQSGTAPNGQ
jgi:hypothetical protein